MISFGRAFVGFMVGIFVRSNLKTDYDHERGPKHIELKFSGQMNFEESQALEVQGAFQLIPRPDGSFVVDGPLKVHGFKKMGVSGMNLQIGGLFSIEKINIASFDLLNKNTSNEVIV